MIDFCTRHTPFKASFFFRMLDTVLLCLHLHSIHGLAQGDAVNLHRLAEKSSPMSLTYPSGKVGLDTVCGK